MVQLQAVIPAQGGGGAGGEEEEQQEAPHNLVQSPLLKQLHHQYPESLHEDHCWVFPPWPRGETLSNDPPGAFISTWGS